MGRQRDAETGEKSCDLSTFRDRKFTAGDAKDAEKDMKKLAVSAFSVVENVPPG